MLVLNQQLTLPAITSTESAISKAFLGVVSEYDTCRYTAEDIAKEFSSSPGYFKDVAEHIDDFAKYLEDKDFDITRTTATALKEDEDEDTSGASIGTSDIDDVSDRPNSFEEVRRADFVRFLTNMSFNYAKGADGPNRVRQKKENIQLGMRDDETGDIRLYVDVKEENSMFNADNEDTARKSVMLAIRQLCDMSLVYECNLMDLVIYKARLSKYGTEKVSQDTLARNIRRWKPSTKSSSGTWIFYSEKTGFRNAKGFAEAYSYIIGNSPYPSEVINMMATVAYVCESMGIDLAQEDITHYTKESLPISVRMLLPNNREYCDNVLSAYQNMTLRGSTSSRVLDALETAIAIGNNIGNRRIIYSKEEVAIQDRDLLDIDEALVAVHYLVGNVMDSSFSYTGGVLCTFGNILYVSGAKLDGNPNSRYVLYDSGLLVPYFGNGIIPTKFKIYDVCEIINAIRVDVAAETRAVLVAASAHDVI